MKSGLIAIALLAAMYVPSLGAQEFRGSRVSEDVRSTIRRAGSSIGMDYVNAGNVDNFISVEYWATGTHAPDGKGSPSPITDFKLSADYGAPRVMRMDYKHGGKRNINVLVVEGNAVTISSWDETEPGGGTIAPAADDGYARQILLWTLVPQAVLKAANEGGTDTKIAMENEVAVIRFPLLRAGCVATGPCENPRVDFTVTLDAQYRPQKVETRSEIPVHGVTSTETVYSDYQDLSESQSGIPFPSRIVMKYDGNVGWDLSVTRVDPDYPNVYILPPASVRGNTLQQKQEETSAEDLLN